VAGAAGATTHVAADAATTAGCMAYLLTAGHAAGDALALAGVKLGLVMWPINLQPVVLWGMP
jgi:hypothetical protein